VTIGRNLVFNLLYSISLVLFPLVTFPYASRILGPEGIGVANFAENLCRYFMLFASLGVPVYGIREISKVSRSYLARSKVFTEIFSIHLITSVCCVAVYLIIVLNFSKFQSHREIYYLGALYIFLNSFTIEWFFNGLSEFKFIAVRAIAIRIIFIFGLFIFVKDSDDVFWFFFLNVLVLLINNVVNFIVWNKKAKLILFRLELRRHLKPLFYIFLSNVAISLYMLIDTLILGIIKGDEAVGYYSLASKLNKVPITVITALGIVLVPQLTKAAHDKDMVKFKALIAKSTDFVVMFGVPAGLCLLVCSKALVILFSGEGFLPAETSVQIMTSVSLLIGLNNLYGMQVLTPLGKDKELLKAVSFGTVLSLALNFALIPVLADRGAAIANVLSELAVTLATAYFAIRAIKIRFPLMPIALQIGCYLPAMGACYFLRDQSFPTLVYFMIVALIMLISFVMINLLVLKVPLAQEVYSKLKNILLSTLSKHDKN
jgi:O-antigen/teichoic acid export membrane protein